MTLSWRRAIALSTMTLVTLVTAMVPAVASPSDEAQFVSLINQSRAGAGLAPLESYADLVDDARRHTADMIAEGQIFHSSTSALTSATTGWAQLGENVGMGPNPTVLHSAFMASPSHRANILGNYDRVGVGADVAPDGTMFVTVIFMQTATPSPTTTTVAPTTTTTATTTTIPTTTTVAAAPPPTTTTTLPVAPAASSPATAPAPPRETPVPVLQEISFVDTDSNRTAWIDLGSGAGEFCVVVRLDGAICVE